MRIRNRLLIYLVGLAAFTLVVIASDSFYNVDTNIISNAESKLEAIATIQNNRVVSQINNYKTQIAQIAGRTGLTDDVVNFNDTGEVAVAESLKAQALDVKSSSPDYEQVFILDENGKIIATTGDKKIEDYFDLANLNSLKQDKKVFISTKNDLSKELVLTGPVKKNDQFEGLIIIISKGEELNNVVVDYAGLGSTGETLLVYKNTNGDVEYWQQPRFADPNKNLIISKDNKAIPAVQALEKIEELHKNDVDYRGVDVMAVSKYIDDVDWGLVAKIDKSEVNAPVYSHATQLGIICLLVLIITILASLKLANTISKPIEELKIGADEVKKSNFTYKVKVFSKDEFAELGSAFNNMVTAVVASRAEIDTKVSKQTKEIQEKSSYLEDQQKAVLNILEDVEEEKEKTTQEKEKISTILQSIGDGVFVVDKDLKITIFNKVASDLSGYEIDEAIGKKYTDVLKFVFEDSGKINDDFIRLAIKTGQTKEMANHTILIEKDGSQIAVADSAAPIKSKNGEIIGCIVVFRDVTKDRQIDKAKTEFVSLASHQLRTPLSSVNWYAEMLIDGDAGKLNKEQSKYVDQIYQGNKRMVALVNALLNVSRIELGTFSIEPELTDIVAMSKSVISEQKEQIEKKKLSVKDEYDKIPKINIDPKLFRMVLQNYISNAIKYTPEKGEIKVKISLQKSGEALGHKVKRESILFEVADTGYGIPKNQQNQIFTKLFRADNVREKETEGTGLGLYIVKSIAEISEGEVWLKSTENKGSTFYFLMPLDGMKKKEGTKKLE